MNTLSYKTISASKESSDHKWYVIDAEDQTLGRMCTQIATMLRGKHKPSYTPHADTGDYIIVINADKIRLTGAKWDQKEYITFSGYPGGQRRIVAKDMMRKKPTKMVEASVKGMLPKNRLGNAMAKKMFVYAGAEHPHGAQKPEKFEL